MDRLFIDRKGNRHIDRENIIFLKLEIITVLSWVMKDGNKKRRKRRLRFKILTALAL
jgi:hypothetical protein